MTENYTQKGGPVKMGAMKKQVQASNVHEY